ncbi:TetR-like C-terminal domain-containing protein [Streptomyces sp. Root369]|uniref:TetR-like C-terminal domain-containing protein n=1 Tax=Streptomyces sp. Root369 TaxID=1736523 RepID=UPI00070C6205|nr:TetR-like C-terminal domain-containing protein [Streptomyces sp. Root369]KQV94127.1 hypothetical protein ASD08_13820 [Streptomyces sp. Root369]
MSAELGQPGRIGDVGLAAGLSVSGSFTALAALLPALDFRSARHLVPGLWSSRAQNFGAGPGADGSLFGSGGSSQLAAEALDHAGLTDDLVPVTIGRGQLRAELIATMSRATRGPDLSRVDLLSALLDTARQEPELCGLVRQRYIDSLHRAVEGVLAHAVERGDRPPGRTDPSGGRPIAVSAAVALLIHWQLVRGRQITDDDIAAIVDAVLMPLL